MRLGEYLRDKLPVILVNIVCMGALALFLRATGSGSIVSIILAVWAVVFAAVLLAGLLRRRRQIDEMEQVFAGLDKKYLLMECISKPGDSYGRALHSLMRRASKSMVEAVSAAEAARAEYKEYIEGWVHEIKAPITALALGMENRGEEGRLLLRQVENHVERALYYARSGHVENDFVIRQTTLAQPVAQAIADHKLSMIGRGMAAETSGLEEAVFTDSKWLTFILGQVIQNSVKYAGPSPRLTVTGERTADGVALRLRDNGPGIPPEELGRIFDKGFVGAGGRDSRQSTGIGLYLCKKLCLRLGLDISADSQPGLGTEIKILFPR